MSTDLSNLTRAVKDLTAAVKKQTAVQERQERRDANRDFEARNAKPQNTEQKLREALDKLGFLTNVEIQEIIQELHDDNLL